MQKSIANCIRHTHWDLIWYFTTQDADVQFSYNMRELLDAFDSGELEHFFMDGQTAPIDTFLRLHPEERDRVQKYVSSGALVIGPFNSQLDCFITSGESVINNMRLGVKTSKALGKVSDIAYLPDSFGHSVDFPKIFNQFGIKDFVITRGVGDEYGLDSEFILKSDDGSTLLVCTMIAGYGYGFYAFKNGDLFNSKGVDYNQINVQQLIKRVQRYSSLPNDFIFPLGFDQNPMLHGVSERLAQYNREQDNIKFVETTWSKYFAKIREQNPTLKVHEGELISTQYHRVHRSIYSGRADIKALQDRCERELTYELQPLMSLASSLGIAYDYGLLDKAWETLILCQTHSSANLTDETNDYIRRETQNALNYATSYKSYLLKLIAMSTDAAKANHAILVVSTTPTVHGSTVKAKVFTEAPNFAIRDGERALPYTLIKQVRKNNGVLRKDFHLIDSTRYYYESDVKVKVDNLEGISYKTLTIDEDNAIGGERMIETPHNIENDVYKIGMEEDGLTIFDKRTGKDYKRAIYLEDMGDEGDSFDYSYPDRDLVVTDSFDTAKVDYKTSTTTQQMVLSGSFTTSKDLDERKTGIRSAAIGYRIVIETEKHSSIIRVSGTINNTAKQHRLRLIFDSGIASSVSYAGTQYSMITRPTVSPVEKDWKENNYFEEPSSIFPLLNHVSTESKSERVTVFTRSSKEYELIGDNFEKIAVTLFRSYGRLGTPDLNRRPGRPSGLDYMVFETPESQMLGDNDFDLALTFSTDNNPNTIFNEYVSVASEVISYQLQSFDKSINPIDYFPTNVLPAKLPADYSLLTVSDSEAVFGTLVKDQASQKYGLRMFNAGVNTLRTGRLHLPETYSCEKGSLTFEALASIDVNQLIFSPGELKNISIEEDNGRN